MKMVAMVRAPGGAWVVVRTGQARPRPVRSHWYVPCKAAWESGVAVVFWKVAMVRASTRPGLWSGRVRGFAIALARPLLCTSMMLPGALMVKWNISKRSHHVNEPMCD